MKIFLVRHGQSEGNINKSKYFEKLDSDIELTDQGRLDAESAAYKIMTISNILLGDNSKFIYPEKPTTHYNMYYSSYKRAVQTANIIHTKISNTHGYSISKFIETPLCREREWGGLRDIVEMGKKTEDHFNFFYKPMGGESFADCYQRVVSFHQWLIQHSKYENNIVVAHGEFNKLYLMHLLNWSVDDFKKWRTPRNGEVYFINHGELSSLTPLSPDIKHNKKL